MKTKTASISHDRHDTWLLGRKYSQLVAVEFTSRHMYLAAYQATLRQRAIKIADRKPLEPEQLENSTELGRTVGEWLRTLGIPANSPIACVIPSELIEYDSVHDVPEDTDLESFSTACLREILGDDARLYASGRWYSKDRRGQGNLNFVWTPQRFAVGLVDGLSKMGFECVGLEAPATVLARVQGGEQPNAEDYRLVVSIDGTQATMVLTRADIAHYVRHHQTFASQLPETCISEARSVSPNSAATLLDHWGIPPGHSTAGSVLPQMLEKAIQPWLSGLLFELERTLRFIRHRDTGINVSQVILCGADSGIPGLCEYLQLHSDLPVCPAVVPSHCNWLSAHQYSPALAVAAAMAMRD